MGIAEITISNRVGCTVTGKTSSRKGWKLSDSLKETIIEYAKEDAAQNVYMGNRFLSLRKSEVAKVAPDRAALIGKMNQAMASDNVDNMKKIKEADEKWLCILFGIPYKAKFQSDGRGSAVHVYDRSGDEVLTYTDGVGWHEKESKAESEVHGALKAVYYDAYHTARQQMKSAAAEGIEYSEVRSGFDVKT